MAFPYREQLEVISTFRLKDGQEHRGNCPFCGGRNTFTANKLNGTVFWNCFRASCGAKGVKDGPPSIKSLDARLRGLKPASRALPELPKLLSRIENQREVKGIMSWLATNHCVEAYEKGLVDIRYAPAEDRIMFKVWNKLLVDEVGWVGRGKKGIKPKWKRYGDCSHLAVVGTSNRAVLVEDICSASGVGVCENYSGVALLGTNLTPMLKAELRQFDEVVICLDPDAQSKALEMLTKLSGLTKVRMIIPPNDLKYFDKEQIMNLLEPDGTTDPKESLRA